VIATATAEAPGATATCTATAVPPTDTPVPAPTDTPTPTTEPTATPTALPVATPTTPPAIDTPAPEDTPPPQSYTVQSGDSLAKIAAEYGVSVAALAAYNEITDPSKIYMGQELRIPPQDYVTPTVEPTPTPVPTATAETVAGMTEAQVVEVVDGDTIKVSIGGQVYTVRYIGIDTPETKHPSKPVEWMGPEASAANEALVGGQTVYLEKDVSETDRYGRLLRYVWLAGGRMVNEELVRQGYAQVSTYPPDVKYQDRFLAAQQEAREAGRGLWGPQPTPVVEATATLVPTQPPAPAAVCSCAGNLYNCKDFATHAQAQACYEYCLKVTGRDVHRLDRDNDGSACESLP